MSIGKTPLEIQLIDLCRVCEKALTALIETDATNEDWLIARTARNLARYTLKYRLTKPEPKGEEIGKQGTNKMTDGAEINRKANIVLHMARTLEGEVTSWADFSNVLFSPTGIVTVMFPNKADREAFLVSWQHQELFNIFRTLMDRFSGLDGATPAMPIEPNGGSR